MNGIETYREASITTQSKGRLIVMLYDGAIKFMKLAIREMEANNFAEKGRYMDKASNIINELNIILDMDAGGEIAQNLRSLYNFIRRNLSQANAKNDPQLVREMISLMESLNQGWKAISS